MMRRTAWITGAAAALLLAGCAGDTSLEGPPEPLGDFSLGYAIVVTDGAQKIGPSRGASPEEWKQLLTRDIEQRFGRYDGDKLYHIAFNLDGYALAVPGIPLVLSPKSAVVVSATVWDDAKGEKLNPEPKQITVLESLSGETIVGSGLTKSREEQMANLSRNTAKLIENWLVENRAEWFGEIGLDAPQAVDAVSQDTVETQPSELAETGNDATPDTAEAQTGN